MKKGVHYWIRYLINFVELPAAQATEMATTEVALIAIILVNKLKARVITYEALLSAHMDYYY